MEVKEKVTKLKELHQDTYTIEQLTCWGHMIQLGKYLSMDCPPDLSYYFKNKKHSVITSENKPCSSSTETVVKFLMPQAVRHYCFNFYHITLFMPTWYDCQK